MYAQGRYRLKEIKDYLFRWGAADRETLATLFFPSSHRAQVVLTSWVKRKELDRVRTLQYIYFLPHQKPRDLGGCIAKTRLDALLKKLDGWRVFESEWNGLTIYTCVRGQKGLRIAPILPQELGAAERKLTSWEKPGKPVILNIVDGLDIRKILTQYIAP